MELLFFGKSDRKNKRFKVVFMKDGKRKTEHFGLDTSNTYLDGASELKRKNYLARHASDLKTNDPTRAGYLSYFVIWGKTRNVETNLKAYLKKFNIKDNR